MITRVQELEDSLKLSNGVRDAFAARIAQLEAALRLAMGQIGTGSALYKNCEKLLTAPETTGVKP